MSDRSGGSRGKRRFSVDALFTDTRPQAAGVSDLPNAREIALERISADPDQPRRTFDPDRLDELIASIRREGILQPITVRYHDESDRYIIIHGERRWRAASAAGLQTIPALIREVPEERRLVQQLMENIVRDDLNTVDRAAALRQLKEQLGDVSWETVAETVGIKRSRLFQLLDTEKLPEPVQDDIRAGRLSEKQSRALQGLAPVFQMIVRDELIAEQLPTAEAHALNRYLRTVTDPGDEQQARALVSDARASRPWATGRASEGEAPVATQPSIDTIAALAALAAVARGETGRISELNAFVRETRLSPRAYRKLTAEIRVLTGMLARLHSAPRAERDAARPLLESLRGTLDALLEQ